MFEKLENENEQQFLWRIGQAKDNGLTDMNWEEVADIMNKQWRTDNSEYLSSSAYRKRYQYAKMLFEANVFDTYKNDDDTYKEELIDIKHEIRKEKQKLFDERTALNLVIRKKARNEEDLQMLKDIIVQNGTTTLPQIEKDIVETNNDLFVSISDFHMGIDVDNNFGTYNSDVAKKRLKEYADKIIEIQNLHNSENAYVGLLGDMISGNIHFTTQLENRQNVIEQVQMCAELLSAFVYELSKHFNNVYVNGVAGNHSRTSFKDQVLRDDRLDNLIPWYMKAKLSHLSNVKFLDEENIDPTIGLYTIRGKSYLMVHGDFDNFSESGVSKLVMMLEFKPEAVFYGHLHKCSYDTISGVKIIRSGSFCGTADDFTVSKRLSGNASQMVCVVTEKGIKACYPVELK